MSAFDGSVFRVTALRRWPGGFEAERQRFATSEKQARRIAAGFKGSRRVVGVRVDELHYVVRVVSNTGEEWD